MSRAVHNNEFVIGQKLVELIGVGNGDRLIFRPVDRQDPRPPARVVTRFVVGTWEISDDKEKTNDGAPR